MPIAVQDSQLDRDIANFDREELLRNGECYYLALK